MYTKGLMLLADMDDFCRTSWNIPQLQIAAAIADTNARTGALRPDLAHNASRILYVNGDVDPWSGLSILNAPSPRLPALMVGGASHHAWTHPTLPTDQPSVVAARAAIHAQLREWLAE